MLTAGQAGLAARCAGPRRSYRIAGHYLALYLALYLGPLMCGWTAGMKRSGPGPGFSPGSSGSSAGDDIVELGRRPRPDRGRRPPVAILLAVAGLLAGLVAGYAAGDRHAGNRAAPRPRASAASSPAAGAFTLTQDGHQCSAQIGPALQLRVQVTNPSTIAVVLRAGG